MATLRAMGTSVIPDSQKQPLKKHFVPEPRSIRSFLAVMGNHPRSHMPRRNFRAKSGPLPRLNSHASTS